MLFLLARELAGVRAAAISQVFFAVLTVCPEWQALAANTELFMLLPMTAATWCVGRALASERSESRKSSWGWWLAAGVLSLVAGLFKQVAMTNVVFLAVWAFFVTRQRKPEHPFRALLPAAGWFVGGMVAVSVITGAIFVMLGSGREFFDCVLGHNFRYSQNVSWRVGRDNLREQIVKQGGTLWGVWLLTALALLNLIRERRPFTALLASWLLFSALGVSIGLYFREHYFIQLAPAFALACGTTLDRWTQRVSETLPAIRASLVTALVAGVCSLPWLMPNLDFWFRSDADWKSRLIYERNPFPESAAFAEHLRRLSQPDETVMIYGSEPQLLFLAERRSATRYILFYPLMMAIPGTLERQQEAIRDMISNRPRVMVQMNLSTSLLMVADAPQYFHDQFRTLRDDGGYKLAGFREYNLRTNSSQLVFQEDADKELERRHEIQDEKKREGQNPQFSYDMLVFVRK